MAKVLSPWCKQAKIELIKRDMSVGELAENVGMTREYISAVVNGRVYSESAVKIISDVLNIKDSAHSLSN